MSAITSLPQESNRRSSVAITGVVPAPAISNRWRCPADRSTRNQSRSWSRSSAPVTAPPAASAVARPLRWTLWSSSATALDDSYSRRRRRRCRRASSAASGSGGLGDIGKRRCADGRKAPIPLDQTPGGIEQRHLGAREAVAGRPGRAEQVALAGHQVDAVVIQVVGLIGETGGSRCRRRSSEGE